MRERKHLLLVQSILWAAGILTVAMVEEKQSAVFLLSPRNSFIFEPGAANIKINVFLIRILGTHPSHHSLSVCGPMLLSIP